MGAAAANTKSDLALRAVQNELEQCETVIAKHGQAFIEVGRALANIRDKQLYKERGFKTFETYCRQRWEMSKTFANHQIAAARMMDALTAIAVKPENESQIRPLLKLPDADRLKVWEMAVETAPNGKVTAKHVAQVVVQQLKDAEDKPEEFHFMVELGRMRSAIERLIEKWPTEQRKHIPALLRSLADEVEQ